LLDGAHVVWLLEWGISPLHGTSLLIPGSV